MDPAENGRKADALAGVYFFAGLGVLAAFLFR